jgi:predicted RNA binding protein YcfA (HicA-like mRNA interferase family)
MKASECVKLLKADKWYLHHHGTEHDFYQHPTKPGTIPIPRHKSKELKKGTLNRILKAAGLK